MADVTEAPAPTLADQLVIACSNEDVEAAEELILGGANPNHAGMVPGWSPDVLPLYAAVYLDHYDLIVMLLAHGADPGLDNAMYARACFAQEPTLELLFDVGGDVNQTYSGRPPLFWAILVGSTENVDLILDHQGLDLTTKWEGKTAEQYARSLNKPNIAIQIAKEVRPSRRLASLARACMFQLSLTRLESDSESSAVT